VHGPWYPPADRRGDGSKRSLYLGVLKTLDEQLGVLFDHLRASPALKDNTLVLVCSDNGPEPGAGKAGPFRGTKGMLYEGGIRSPLIVWGPGFIEAGKAGQRNDTSVFAAFDLVPSLLSLCDVPAPANVKFDGENIRATLTGGSTASRQDPIFWRRPPDRPGPKGEHWPDLAIRAGRWKLVCEYDGSRAALYDLEADREETSDVAAANPAITKRLSAAATAWHRSMPPDNGAALRNP
jgi:uncharacterized sulfatase